MTRNVSMVSICSMTVLLPLPEKSPGSWKSPRIKRMDSMMIAANIRKFSRSELFYTCLAKLVIYLHKNKQDSLIE